MPSMRLSSAHRGATRLKPCCHARLARDVRARASFGDKLRDIWEKSQFENWAPKSSRVWRLRQYPSEVATKQEAEDAEQFSSSLEKRMAQLSQDAQSTPPADRSPTSFTSSTDSEVASALNQRLGMASVDGSVDGGDTLPDVAPDAPLTPDELVALVESKYKNRYDMTIARRNFAGKTFVSLNIMWVHTAQRSFPMSEEDYMDKVDGICMLLNVWNKQAQVRAFLKEKPKAKNGMPPRPIVGCAVAIQLELAPEVVEEWLGNRMG